jgi:hypothetical protein
MMVKVSSRWILGFDGLTVDGRKLGKPHVLVISADRVLLSGLLLQADLAYFEKHLGVVEVRRNGSAWQRWRSSSDCLFECGSACRPHLTDAARDGPLGYARKE